MAPVNDPINAIALGVVFAGYDYAALASRNRVTDPLLLQEKG